jgi:hypothetical protein
VSSLEPPRLTPASGDSLSGGLRRNGLRAPPELRREPPSHPTTRSRVVDVLEAEMKAKKLNILGYVQELLLRRYETLRHSAPSRSSASEPRERKRR